MSSRLYARIQQAYDIIGNHTPLLIDCGSLCGGACCQGGDELGMLLFPGESHRLSYVPEFKVSKIKYMDGRAWFLSCPGNCDRSLRPLACRIFPLAPLVDPQGKVTAIPDPRGRRMCPLAEGHMLDPGFQRAVGNVFSHLAQEPRILEFMKMISQEVTELLRFYSDIGF